MHITLEEFDPKPESPMKIQWLFLLVFISIWIILALVFFVPNIQSAFAQADEPASADAYNFHIYLPAIMGGSGTPPSGTNDVGKLWLPFTLTDSSVLPTYGASVAVDANGGNHAAYALYTGTDEQGNQPATYTYCPSQCSDPQKWTSVHLGEAVQEVRLALDQYGHPRLMLFGSVYDPTFPRKRYQYATCNSACTNAANWTLTTIATPIEAVGTREYDNNHYFAMDKQGRPAFIYTDTYQNDHPGTFYLSCQSSCTNFNQWTETTLLSGAIDKPTLTFSPSGQPRLAFGYYDQDQNLYLAYAQCDAGCTDANNWSAVSLAQLHGTAKYNLQVDSNGNPRLGFYSGSYGYAPFDPQQLYYLWCNTGCTTDAGNWFLSNTNMPFGSGDGVDIALDKLNRPRLSFQIAGKGLGYAWCNTNCESTSSAWQSVEVESQQSLSHNFEVLPVQRCTVSTWFNGQRTSLALDPAGNPRFGYDAQHWWFGTEMVNGVPVSCNYQDVTVARYALAKQP
jgi:hypothetical protein